MGDLHFFLSSLKCILTPMTALWKKKKIACAMSMKGRRVGNGTFLLTSYPHQFSFLSVAFGCLASSQTTFFREEHDLLTLSTLSWATLKGIIFMRLTQSQIQGTYLQTFPSKVVVIVTANNYMPTAFLPMQVIIMSNIYSSFLIHKVLYKN